MVTVTRPVIHTNTKYESLNSKQIRNHKFQFSKPAIVWDFGIRIYLGFRI